MSGARTNGSRLPSSGGLLTTMGRCAEASHKAPRRPTMRRCHACRSCLGRQVPFAGGGWLTHALTVSDPFVLLPGEAPLLELGNFQALVLAADRQTCGEFTLLQTQSEPSGFGPPMHLHRDAAEAFYVLEGEYLMYLEDRQQLCPPGTFVYVPRAVPHTFKVASAGPGKKLNLFSPAAMAGFFEDLAEAEAAGIATPSELDKIAAKHHMEVLGPVPDTYL